MEKFKCFTHESYNTNPGDTRLFQFYHEWLLRWLTYMKVDNADVGNFLSMVSLYQLVACGYFFSSHNINDCPILTLHRTVQMVITTGTKI